MKLFGMGLPELVLALWTLIVPAVCFIVLYFVVKKAVKAGVSEALAERDQTGRANASHADE